MQSKQAAVAAILAVALASCNLDREYFGLLIGASKDGTINRLEAGAAYGGGRRPSG